MINEIEQALEILVEDDDDDFTSEEVEALRTNARAIYADYRKTHFVRPISIRHLLVKEPKTEVAPTNEELLTLISLCSQKLDYFSFIKKSYKEGEVIWFKDGKYRFFKGIVKHDDDFPIYERKKVNGVWILDETPINNGYEYLLNESIKNKSNGVFFLPGKPQDEPLKTHQKATNFVSYEIDNISIDEQEKFLEWLEKTTSLEASSVVYSGGKSDHVNFCTDEDLPIEENHILRRYLAVLGIADPAITSVSQAMRLPGFRRVSDTHDSIQRLKKLTDKKYSRSAFYDAFKIAFEARGWEYQDLSNNILWAHLRSVLADKATTRDEKEIEIKKILTTDYVNEVKAVETNANHTTNWSKERKNDGKLHRMLDFVDDVLYPSLNDAIYSRVLRKADQFTSSSKKLNCSVCSNPGTSLKMFIYENSDGIAVHCFKCGYHTSLLNYVAYLEGIPSNKFEDAVKFMASESGLIDEFNAVKKQEKLDYIEKLSNNKNNKDNNTMTLIENKVETTTEVVSDKEGEAISTSKLFTTVENVANNQNSKVNEVIEKLKVKINEYNNFESKSEKEVFKAITFTEVNNEYKFGIQTISSLWDSLNVELVRLNTNEDDLYLTGEEFLDEYGHDISEDSWLWEGIIPSMGLLIWVGLPGIGKSLFWWWLSGIVTTGGSVNGLKVTQGEVLYIQTEESVGVIKKRLSFIKDRTKIHIRRDFDIDHDFDSLRRKLTKNPNIKLVIIDSLMSVSGGIDLTKEDIRVHMYKLQALFNDLGILGVILHHPNAEGKVYGNRAITGASDGNLFMNPGDHKNLRVLKVIKQRQFPSYELNNNNEINIALDENLNFSIVEDLGEYLKENPSDDNEPTPKSPSIEERIISKITELTIDDPEQPVLRREVADKLKFSDDYIAEVLKGMVAEVETVTINRRKHVKLKRTTSELNFEVDLGVD